MALKKDICLTSHIISAKNLGKHNELSPFQNLTIGQAIYIWYKWRSGTHIKDLVYLKFNINEKDSNIKNFTKNKFIEATTGIYGWSSDKAKNVYDSIIKSGLTDSIPDLY